MVYKSKFDSIEIPKCNILSYLFPENETLSEKPIWIDADAPSNSLSPKQMLSYVKRFVVGLEKLNIGQQVAIMVFTPNHIFVPLAYLAAAGSRRYYTGANPAYTVTELAHQISNVQPGLFLVHPSLVETGLAAAKMAGLSRNMIYLFGEGEFEQQNGLQPWTTILASMAESESWKWDNLGDEALSEIATINFSSGTTGVAKGVCNTHYNLVSNVAQVLFALFEGPSQAGTSALDPKEERWLATLPLYHAFSQLYTIGIACRLQLPIYVMKKFSLSGFLNNIQRYRITTVQTVPPVMSMLAKLPEDQVKITDFSTLRNAMVGAAPMSVGIEEDVINTFRVFVSRGWGMTETTCVGTLTLPNTRNVNGSVGFLIPNTTAKLVDDNGNEISDGPGELLLRGPQIMLGYWRNEAATKEIITPDGWLRTGDVAVIKDDMWYIVDRKKELIKVNGLQVAPAELEAVLLQHPEVTDAAVVGMMLSADLELPRAYIVMSTGRSTSQAQKEEVQKFVADRVSRHKWLAGGIMVVDEIPRLLSGKIRRGVVKEWALRDAKGLSDRPTSRL